MQSAETLEPIDYKQAAYTGYEKVEEIPEQVVGLLVVHGMDL